MRVSLRTMSLLTALAAGIALAVALVSQYWGGVVPCPLCLVERWPWRVAIVLALVAIVAPARVARLLLALSALAIFADAALAFVHVGVERHFWTSPLPQCQAPVLSGSIADRLRALPAEPSAACEDPSYLIAAIPISIATMNLIYALVIGTALAIFLADRRRTP